LLTGVVFVLVLRHRRKKRRQLRRGNSTSTSENIGHLKAYSVASQKGYASSDDGSSTYSTDGPGFNFPGDIKPQAPAAVPATSSSTVSGIPRKNVTSGVGYALSYSRPRPSMSLAPGNLFTIMSSKSTSSTQAPPKFQLGNPPPPRGAAAATAVAETATASGGKFSLFPSPRTSPRPTSPEDPKQQQQGTQRMSNGGLPSLDRWLRDRTDVSPISTLRGGGDAPAGGR
jgi:hypothetical protein